MHVQTRVRDGRPGYVGVKIKCYLFIIIIMWPLFDEHKRRNFLNICLLNFDIHGPGRSY